MSNAILRRVSSTHLQRTARFIRPAISAVFLTLLVGPAAAQTVRVMPLGDSITVGVGDPSNNGYRASLYQALDLAGYSVDFVGSQTSGTLPDTQHEGHSGWQANAIRDNITGWLNTTPADIVLLHIGTNDISGGQAAAGVLTEIEQILNNIDAWETAHSATVTVVLARIVNRSNPLDALGVQTTTLNNSLQTLANTRAAAGDRILVVDHEAALTYPADMADTVHPNVSGYSKMAATWEPAVAGLIGEDWIDQLALTSTSGQNLTTDDLTCSYTLTGSAVTAASAWYVNGSPFARLYLPMEGGAVQGFKDYSGNNLTLTPGGDPVWIADAGHDGRGAIEFDGNDDLNAGENFPINSSYTKVAWVYRTGSGNNGGNNIISGNQDPGGHALWAPDMYGNKLSAGHNGTWNSVQDTVALALNTWYHVALTYDSTTQLMTLYKNGSFVQSATVTTAVSDTTLSIGSFGSSNGWHWKGQIDDARVYARALSADQIAALHSAGQNVIDSADTTVGDAWQCRVTPFSSSEAGMTEHSNILTIAGPVGLANLLLSSSSGFNMNGDDLLCTFDLTGEAVTAANAWYLNGSPAMRLYLPMEGGAVEGFKDFSGNNLSIAKASDPAWFATAGHNGFGAIEFDGNDDLSAGENFPTNSSYTKAAWVYRTGSGNNGGNNIVAGNDNSGGHAFWAPDMYGNKLSAGHNGTWNSVQDTVALALNTWYHVAVTYNNSTKQMVLYKNGSPIKTATVNAAVTDTTISIGSFGAANGYMWKGYLDDVRIYTRALSSEQIAVLHASGAHMLADQETAVSDQWQCRVTPFSSTEKGITLTSNTLIIGSDIPPPSNLQVTSTSGLNLDGDDLICSYTLPGSAVTAASAWYVNGSPFARLYLPMEGGAVQGFKDYSGNNLTITPGGDPAWIANAGHDGRGAIEFDGNDDLNAGENFPINSSYTKVAWVYRTGSGNNGGNNIISGNQDPGGHALWAPDMYGNKLSAGHNATWNSVQDTAALALNTWYHVAVTYDAVTQQMVLYKNGAVVDSETVTAPVSDTTISIGYFGSGWNWRGFIDDARVYARALSADQIAALHSAGQNVIDSADTTVGDAWQCRVTPFSSSEAGPTTASNTVAIIACDLPTITQEPTPAECCAGGQAAFTIAAEGLGTLHYAWTVNAEPAGADSPQLTLDAVQPALHGAQIRCTVSNLCGPVQSAPATLCVHTPPAADFDGDCDVDQADLLSFVGCQSGPAMPHNGQPICDTADLDQDSDVDTADFGLFQRCFTGEGGYAVCP